MAYISSFSASGGNSAASVALITGPPTDGGLKNDVRSKEGLRTQKKLT